MKDVGSCAWLLHGQLLMTIVVVLFVVVNQLIFITVASASTTLPSGSSLQLHPKEAGAISINPDLIFADLRAGHVRVKPADGTLLDVARQCALNLVIAVTASLSQQTDSSIVCLLDGMGDRFRITENSQYWPNR